VSHISKSRCGAPIFRAGFKMRKATAGPSTSSAAADCAQDDNLIVMRFSERTGWNTEESELARAHRLRREAGLPIADLTASNPTRCGFKYPDSLLGALADARALVYDPQPRGLLLAREAVCRYYADHG